MFYLFLESVALYGNLKDDIQILVYTSSSFRDMITRHRLFCSKILFEINDTYGDLDKSCKSRLDFFRLTSSSNYEKILYLDTDIIVKSDVSKVFDICVKDILYALEEGVISDPADYYGKTLFGNEINKYKNYTAFTSGILLFNNCETIKNLFRNISEDIINRPHFFCAFDQPYIVYNAFKYNLYDNKILKFFAVNNDHNVHSNKVIHHFPGGVGVFGHKIINMQKFLNNMKSTNNARKSMSNKNKNKTIKMTFF
jgi:lipopolysaccharide biosynthesis glycosyltransferase